jgi:hypothetical protein
MSKRKRERPKSPVQAVATKGTLVDSIYDAIQEGNEYGSIVSVLPKPRIDLVDEIVKGIRVIEGIRSRPCLTYVGNVVRSDDMHSAIETADDLPFAEMLQRVQKDYDKVDIFLATMGGSAHQVSRFVNFLRGRFEEVDFLIPSFCMSAGTLFALAGNNVWMNPTACLGPIDPQVPTKDGRYVPAQALLVLVRELQQQGDDAMKNSRAVPWTAVRIVDSLDKKELGDAITASAYSVTMATEFLSRYKFKNWTTRETSRLPVTDEYRKTRASEIASALASHDRWKNHGHSIPRDVLWQEIKLRIEHPPLELERAIARLWALLYWIFDKTPIIKVIVSQQYRFVRHSIRMKQQL